MSVANTIKDVTIPPAAEIEDSSPTSPSPPVQKSYRDTSWPVIGTKDMIHGWLRYYKYIIIGGHAMPTYLLLRTIILTLRIPPLRTNEHLNTIPRD